MNRILSVFWWRDMREPAVDCSACSSSKNEKRDSRQGEETAIIDENERRKKTGNSTNY
jgi:hypothetical protein